MIGVKVSTRDWRAGRNIALASSLFPKTRDSDSHVEDRIDDKQYAVFRGPLFAFVNKYRAIRKKL